MTNDNEMVMTVREVSEFLRVGENTVYRLAHEGKLPGRKVGGKWRFMKGVLLEWLSRPGEEAGDAS